MWRLTGAFLVFVASVAVIPHAAEAVTLREIIELSRAGLSDDVLVALIDVDGGVFPVDAATLARLKAEGVSDRVIVAMLRSGRQTAAPEPSVPFDADPSREPQPQVLLISGRASMPALLPRSPTERR